MQIPEWVPTAKFHSLSFCSSLLPPSLSLSPLPSPPSLSLPSPPLPSLTVSPLPSLPHCLPPPTSPFPPTISLSLSLAFFLFPPFLCLLIQDPCNGHGRCTCEGRCQCDPPYIGTYCEVCSGNVTSGCAQFTCDTNQQCAQCALNVVTQFIDVDAADFFTAETLMGGQLPNGSQLVMGLDGNAVGIRLPPSLCANCSQITLINGTDQVEYEINCKCQDVKLFIHVRQFMLRVWNACQLKHSVHSFELGIHDYSQKSCSVSERCL